MGGHVAHLNFKTSRVSVFINACRVLSALRSLSQFGRGRLSLVAISFYTLSWAMSLVGIYPGRASGEYSPSGVLNLIDIVH